MFKPGTTAPVNHNVGVASTRVALPGKGNVVRLALEGSQDIHIKFGDGTVEAVASDLLVKGNSVVEFFRPAGASHVATICAAATNVMNVATGEY